MNEQGQKKQKTKDSIQEKMQQIEPRQYPPSEKPPNRCPYCNSILIVNYKCGYVVCLWSMFLLIGATCWVPCVVDGCKNAEHFCRTCDRNVFVTKAKCCCD